MSPELQDQAPAQLQPNNRQTLRQLLAPSQTVEQTQVTETQHVSLVKLSKTAKQTGVAQYIEPGEFKYSVVHGDDAAELYIHALQNGKAGSVYHAVSESGITNKAITEAIARMLGCKVIGISKIA